MVDEVVKKDGLGEACLEDGFEVLRELGEAFGILFVVPLAVAKFWNDALGSERPGTCIGDVGSRGPMEDVHRVDSMNSRGASWKSLVRDNVREGVPGSTPSKGERLSSGPRTSARLAGWSFDLLIVN